jgi:hypothetical protein
LRVVRQVAHGGMGLVFAPHYLGFERDMTLEILLTGARADRFVCGSKITARLARSGRGSLPPRRNRHRLLHFAQLEQPLFS